MSYDKVIVVCGRWPIHLQDTRDTHKRSPFGTDPFSQYFDDANLSRRLVPLSRFTWCWLQVVQYINSKYNIDSVAELFGGVGRTTVLIQNVLKPTRHIVMDIDDVQYRQLQSLIGEYNIDVLLGDAFQVSASLMNVDLVALDYSVTACRLQREFNNMRLLLIKAARSNPKVITITDSAASKLHLHPDAYTYDGFTPKTYLDYLIVLDMVVYDLIGYNINFVAYYNYGLACVVLGTNEDFIVVNDDNSPISRKCLEVVYDNVA